MRHVFICFCIFWKWLPMVSCIFTPICLVHFLIITKVKLRMVALIFKVFIFLTRRLIVQRSCWSQYRYIICKIYDNRIQLSTSIGNDCLFLVVFFLPYFSRKRLNIFWLTEAWHYCWPTDRSFANFSIFPFLLQKLSFNLIK